MRSKKEQICACIRCMLFVGMSLQILLGIVWLVPNMASLQDFKDTKEYLQAAERIMNIRQYLQTGGLAQTGLLYPMILVVVQGMGKRLPVPYYTFLYIFQLAAAFWAVQKLGGMLGIIRKCGRLKAAWYGLVLLTIPMLMQCHLAVLPHSLALSCFLLCLSELGRSMETETKVGGMNIVKACLWWIAAILLMQEYLWFGAAAVFVFVLVCVFRFLRSEKKHYRLILWLLLPVFLLGGLSAGQSAFSGRTYGELITRSMVSRFVWPYFHQHYPVFSEDFFTFFFTEDAVTIDFYAEGVEEEFFPLMEEELGREAAQKYYVRMAKITWGSHTREITFRILWDILGCSAAPWMMDQQLGGAGYESFTGRNYDIMMTHVPEVTAVYVRYGNWWFCVGVVLCVVLAVIEFLTGRSGKRAAATDALTAALEGGAAENTGTWFCVAPAVVMIILTAMSGAGIMDYKKVIFVTLLWYLWMISKMRDTQIAD